MVQYALCAAALLLLLLQALFWQLQLHFPFLFNVFLQLLHLQMLFVLNSVSKKTLIFLIGNLMREGEERGRGGKGGRPGGPEREEEGGSTQVI